MVLGTLFMLMDKSRRNICKGSYDEDEERVAGSPEYAFNEYLRIAVECGIPVLVLVLTIIGGCLYRGIKKKRIGICGGLISLLFSLFLLIQ